MLSQRPTRGSGRYLRAALITLAAVLAGIGATVGPAFATGEQAVLGMPSTAKWAYNTHVNPPYTDNNSSHPSVHHTPGGGDWGTDVYGGPGTPVKLLVTYANGSLSFVRVSSSTSCGQSIRINVLVNGVVVGWVYFAHLDNVPGGAITNGMIIGNMRNWACLPVTHIHVEFKNLSGNHSCYADHGNPGVTINEGAHFGVLGSGNTAARQACGSIPSPPINPPADTDGDGTPDSADVAPLMAGESNNRGYPRYNRVLSGDFDGDNYGDIALFYNYGNAQVKVITFKGGAAGLAAPVVSWDSGVGTWDWHRIKTVATDTNGDNKDDIVVLYDYGSGQVKLITLYGSTTGPAAPVVSWDSGLGAWEWHRTYLTAGDFNGDGYGDVGVAYDYGSAQVKVFTFRGSNTGPLAPIVAWDSGVGTWEWYRLKVVTTDTNGDSKDDIVVLYDFGSGQTKAAVFNGTAGGLSAPSVAWDSGAGMWDWSRSTPIVGDFNGDGYGDLGALYDFSNGQVKFITFKGSAVGLQTPVVSWDSGLGTWEWYRLLATTQSVDITADGQDDVGVFYDFGNAQVKLVIFSGAAPGPAVPSVSWDSGPGAWEWYRI